MLEPYKGRVLDPCCGSGGMFVQSEKFVEQHQGRVNDISIFGQESNQTTWRLCKMNLAIRGIDASQVKWNTEGSFLNDAHRDVKVDYVIANPPFNDSDWSGDLCAMMDAGSMVCLLLEMPILPGYSTLFITLLRQDRRVLSLPKVH